LEANWIGYSPITEWYSLYQTLQKYFKKTDLSRIIDEWCNRFSTFSADSKKSNYLLKKYLYCLIILSSLITAAGSWKLT
jgi:hypothetical protein